MDISFTSHANLKTLFEKAEECGDVNLIKTLHSKYKNPFSEVSLKSRLLSVLKSGKYDMLKWMIEYYKINDETLKFIIYKRFDNLGDEIYKSQNKCLEYILDQVKDVFQILPYCIHINIKKYLNLKYTFEDLIYFRKRFTRESVRDDEIEGMKDIINSVNKRFNMIGVLGIGILNYCLDNKELLEYIKEKIGDIDVKYILGEKNNIKLALEVWNQEKFEIIDNIKVKYEGECPICLSGETDCYRVCGHAYHFSCLQSCFDYERRCCICKNPNTLIFFN